jgi:exosortase E/protease (VPEID-CTERM system)
LLPFSLPYFVGHILCFGALSLESYAAATGVTLLPPATLWTVRLILAVLAVALLALACIPFQAWREMFRLTGRLWLYAIIAGALARLLREPMQSIWTGADSTPGRLLQRTTFDAVELVLRPILPKLYVDAPSFIMGTSRFSVFIAQACSGLEGLGLVLVFTVAWLWYLRKEFRFPHALLLIPCALACVWTLNILRIAALVLIGNAGAAEVAMVGFHSQAGWIAFTAVALAFTTATRKLAWVRKQPTATPAIAHQTGESAATTAYLLPFLAILAASFVSKAASGNFEWLYPLRFLAAAIALWHFRGAYRKLDLRCGWRAPLTGLFVFLLWIAPSFFSETTAISPLGDALDNLSPAARFLWIAFRVAAAVLTVPIAEELAFRGFLARRIAARGFDQVPFRNLTLIPIALSSIAFGLMHGHDWLVGIIAGLAFALVLRSKGRIGDTIVAHATSNLLLAVWVLTRHDWSQW